MCEAAVTAARAIGYVNAGTVEFVLDGDGAFWFLEVNTRLQVEHPVTELVTGIDLVAVQLAIAEGSPLPPEVVDARTTGHAIEARLYAEDVGAGYLPVTGTLHRFRIPARDGIRVDAGYTDGSEITTFYDALLAKVVAWAPTRDEATRVLVGALRSAEIHGPPTNRDLLVSVLDHAAWTRGDTDTEFLDRHLAARDESGAVADGLLEQQALAAALATRAARRTPLPRGIPYAWRNVGPAHQVTQYRAGEQVVDVDLTGLGARAVVHAAARDHVDLELDGAREVVRVHRVGVTVFVDSAEGSTTLEELPRFPTPASEEAEGSLLAPLPGSVVQLPVAVGDVLHVGDVLIALEAMKMEHAIRAPRDGVVTEVRVVLGEQVDTGAVLVVVEPADRREPDPVAGAGAG
jgi:acetyl/propionyl-CoA carboxylase alpha subunit